MRFFRGTKYWQAQIIGLLGGFCVVLALNGPMTQHRRPSGINIGHWETRTAFFENGPSFLAAGDGFTRLSSYLLLAVMCCALWALFNLRISLLRRLALLVGAATVVVIVAGTVHLQTYYFMIPRNLKPIYFQPPGFDAVGWAWIPLLLAPFVFIVASFLVDEPSAEERMQLFKQFEPNLPVHLTGDASSPGNAPVIAASTPAIASDSGLCEACGTKNSVRATRCYKCATVLPWEKARLEKKQQSAQAKAAVKTQVAASSSRLGAGSGEFFKTASISIFVFLVCAMVPFFGYFIWQHLDNDGSDYSGPAFWGMLLGGICVIGGFLVRMLATMAKVSAM